MIPSCRHLPLLLLACALSTVNPALAASITYRFEGQVFGADLGSIPDGTRYTGTFSYADDSPDLNTNPDIGEYVYNAFELTIGSDTIFADLSASAPGTPPHIFINNFPGADDLVVFANPAGGVVGTYASVIAFSVGFSGSAVFDSTALPGTGLTIGDFQFANISVLAALSNGVQVSFGGSVESLRAIPLPAASWLFCSGALALASMMRRRQSA